MMTKIRQAVKLYRDAGLKRLARRSIEHVKWVSKKWAFGMYYRMRGTKQLHVEGTTATFLTTTNADATAIRFFLENERSLLQSVLSDLRPDDVFLDVGANIGLYTCLVGDYLSEGTVVAVEPYPPNVARLRQNIRRNGLNVQVETVALTDSPGSVEFEYHGETTRGTPSIATDEVAHNVTVDADTADRLVDRGTIPQPAVVKIDVEGAESLVIDGMRDTLGDDGCRTVYCEVHLPTAYRTSIDDYGSSPEEVRTALETVGFAVEELYRRGGEVMLKGTKPS